MRAAHLASFRPGGAQARAGRDRLEGRVHGPEVKACIAPLANISFRGPFRAVSYASLWLAAASFGCSASDGEANPGRGSTVPDQQLPPGNDLLGGGNDQTPPTN